jgi:CTP synthase
VAKYLFVTGGVMSGLGKGVAAASIGKILLTRGAKVSALKIDPYLNVDAGTMNPVVHGEVFVTEDGGETDMDLGTYERFLDVNLSKMHNITTGQVYQTVIGMERSGSFLGQCVQIIPHVTEEIKRRIRSVAESSKSELLLVEIGGTVGDIESLPFLEAAREMRLDDGYRNVVFAHVTLVPVVGVVGEQKTKPTQHSVQELRRIGLQPDLIIARSSKPLLPGPRKKIALFCNVDEGAVFSSPDSKSLYEVPMLLEDQGMGAFLCERLGLDKKAGNWDEWNRTVQRFVNPKNELTIAVCGKYAELADSYVSVNEALRHAGAAADTRVNLSWIETEQFEGDEPKIAALATADGVLVPGGFGQRGTEGKIRVIRYAREHDIPVLGICFGFQLAIVEFARTLGLEDANSTEIASGTQHPVIDLMPEQRSVDSKGATMRLGAHEIRIQPGTLAERLYGRRRVWERHRHRYEVNPDYISKLEQGGLVFSGRSLDGRRMEILEIPSHYFFIATQFHGEFRSRPMSPSPPYYGLVKASLDKKLGKPRIELGSGPSITK